MIIQYRDGEGCSLPISILFVHLPGVATSRCCRHLDLMPFFYAVIVYLCRSSGSSRYIAQLFVSPPTYIAVCLPPCLFSSPPETCLYDSDFSKFMRWDPAFLSPWRLRVGNRQYTPTLCAEATNVSTDAWRGGDLNSFTPVAVHRKIHPLAQVHLGWF